jgi:lipoprotein-anchoring transpeptidase ErfK/SrfK
MLLRLSAVVAFVVMLTAILLWSAISAPAKSTTLSRSIQPALISATGPTVSPLPSPSSQPARQTAQQPAEGTTAPTATPAPELANPDTPAAEEPATAEPQPETDTAETELEPDAVAFDVAAPDQVQEDEALDGAAGVDETEDIERHALAYAPQLDAGWEDAVHTPGGGMMGVVLATVNLRSAPSVDAPVVSETYAGHLVAVYGVTAGDWVAESDVWYVVGPEEYVAADYVAPFVPSPPESTWDGHWVDVNLSTGYVVAYVDATPVYAAITMVGKPGYETPVGVFTIFERVESETLDSATVGILEGDPEYYYLESVLYTQYFADDGFALHTNDWDPSWAFLSAGSHGCVNLLERDAAWFWDFLYLGSVVSVHY